MFWSKKKGKTKTDAIKELIRESEGKYVVQVFKGTRVNVLKFKDYVFAYDAPYLYDGFLEVDPAFISTFEFWLYDTGSNSMVREDLTQPLIFSADDLNMESFDTREEAFARVKDFHLKHLGEILPNSIPLD